MMEIRKKINQLALEFNCLGDEFLRYTFLVELGGLLEPLEDSWKTDERLFQGCQSRVWLMMEVQGGRLFLRGDSDTVVMRGILYILCMAYGGALLEDAAEEKTDLMAEIGLKNLFSSERYNGINGIVKKIREFCRSYRG